MSTNWAVFTLEVREGRVIGAGAVSREINHITPYAIVMLSGEDSPTFRPARLVADCWPGITRALLRRAALEQKALLSPRHIITRALVPEFRRADIRPRFAAWAPSLPVSAICEIVWALPESRVLAHLRPCPRPVTDVLAFQD